MQQQEQQELRQPEASSSASASSSSEAPNYNYKDNYSYNNTSPTATAPPSTASSFRGGPYSRTLLDEIREVLAQSYLIFLLADLHLMSGTGQIRTKYETLIIDSSDLYSQTKSRNIAGLVEPDPDEFPLPPAILLQPTQSQVFHFNNNKNWSNVDCHPPKSWPFY